jgi:threonine synthase
MRYYSTRNRNEAVSFARAVLSGIAPDGGLFVPETIPPYRAAVLASLGTMTIADVAFETIRPFTAGEIPDAALQDIVRSAYTFDAPLVPVAGRFVLELFHGPTAAFKDFGARFMARTFAWLRRGETKPLKILVATSGDTGGAVADGFFGIEGISVTVLYPKGRVSPLQERQIAGLGGNISALAVEGSFDDCQRLVKAAFADAALRKRLDLSSANSINIARLLPQAVYYALGNYAVGAGKQPALIFCVPSGNFGNLTAGLYAMKMGAPIRRFVAATNINKTVPDYLESGKYEARGSQATLSNAMDVGAPSNFERMSAHWSYHELRERITGVWTTDEDTRKTIKRVHEETGYVLDPHGAVGWHGLDALRENGLLEECPAAVLETAHPAKFGETVEPLVGTVPMPPALSRVMERSVLSITIPAELPALLEVI